MKQFRLFGLGLVSILAAGCVSAADDGLLQTRTEWLSRCPSDPPLPTDEKARAASLLGALVTAIAPKLIEGAVDSAAEALKAAGQSKTIGSTARTATNFYSVSQDADLKAAVTCLVVVRGKFNEGAVTPLDWAANTREFRSLARPIVQLEAKIAPLRGLKYFQLVPQYLKVEDFEEWSFFRKDRDFSVAATFTVPGAAQPFGTAEFLIRDVEKGTELRPGDWRLRSAASLPIAFPPESVDAGKAKSKREGEIAPFLLAIDILTPPKPKEFTKAPSVYQDASVVSAAVSLCTGIRTLNGQLPKAFELNDGRCAYPLEKPRDGLEAALEAGHRNAARRSWAQGVCVYKPGDDATGTPAACTNLKEDPKLSGAVFTYITTQVTLSETREGSKFAMFLGNSLAAAKTDVSAALKQKLLPKTQQQLEAEEAGARDARTAVIIADLEVTKAEESLAEVLQAESPKPAAVTAARIALVKAKIEANKAYRKADLPVPFPELD